jgi:hypothetical protein
MQNWKQTKLSPGFTIATWEAIRSRLNAETYNDDWETAIAAIEDRFNQRLITPVDAIQALDAMDSHAFPEGRGFAIVALDCLLLESLYRYEAGRRTRSSGETSAAFEALLSSKTQFAEAFAPEGRAASFSGAVRNGLLHDGETRGGWLIWRGRAGGALVQRRSDNRLVLNRDAFHAAVKESLAEYFAKLRRPRDPAAAKLRKALMDRIDALCTESEPKSDP